MQALWRWRPDESAELNVCCYVSLPMLARLVPVPSSLILADMSVLLSTHDQLDDWGCMFFQLWSEGLVARTVSE